MFVYAFMRVCVCVCSMCLCLRACVVVCVCVSVGAHVCIYTSVFTCARVMCIFMCVCAHSCESMRPVRFAAWGCLCSDARSVEGAQEMIKAQVKSLTEPPLKLIFRLLHCAENCQPLSVTPPLSHLEN